MNGDIRSLARAFDLQGFRVDVVGDPVSYISITQREQILLHLTGPAVTKFLTTVQKVHSDGRYNRHCVVKFVAACTVQDSLQYTLPLVVSKQSDEKASL